MTIDEANRLIDAAGAEAADTRIKAYFALSASLAARLT